MIEVGDKIRNKYIPNASIEIIRITEETNAVKVYIKKDDGGGSWDENWMLDATKRSVADGSYELIKGD